MNQVKIGKIIYNIIDKKGDEISICYRIRQGNKIKNLTQNKRTGIWELQIEKNNINEISICKPCQPQFLSEE